MMDGGYVRRNWELHCGTTYQPMLYVEFSGWTSGQPCGTKVEAAQALVTMRAHAVAHPYPPPRSCR